MPNTYTLIASNTVGTAVSSITFSSIPSTYTDLLLKWSASTSNTSRDQEYITFNGTSTNYSGRVLRGFDNTNVGSTTSATTSFDMDRIGGGTNYTNVFTNSELYVPNYASSNNKSVSLDTVLESSATSGTSQFISLEAGLWSNSAAITSITFAPAASNYVQYSTFYLYGIKNS